MARLYGEILRDLGLLSKGKFIIKNPSDFIGDVIGASEKQTNAILDNAIGSVLVIDEAYGLLGTKGISSFKEAVIDTIVSKIQNVPGDDRCVLLLGYQEEMNRLFNECHNPGLKGRFDAQNPFVFEDFDDDQLFSILQMKAKEAHLDISMDASMKAISILGKQRMQKHFANGRAVCTLLNAAMQHMSQRNIHDLAEIKGGKQIEVTVADFEKCMPTATADPKELFGDLIGVQKLLDRIQKLTNNIKYAQRLGQDPLSRMDLTFAFVGRPGTGKTTVAERMGTLFSALGLLASAEVISISASQLQTGFVGQAGGQTRKIFDSALGKVLFIDEAYRLNPGIRQHNYMREVVDEIVNLLTEPAFKNKLVVIFAGYKKEMMEMLQANSGLRSRVPNVWEFEDFNAQDSTMILQAKLKANSLLLSAEAEAMLPGAMQQCIDGLGNDWSNGRSVSNWATKIISQVAQRVMAKETKTGEKQDLTSGQKVIPEDLSATLEALLSTLAGDDADTDAKTIITEVHLPSAVMPAPMHQHAPSFSVKATSKQTQASRAALEEKEKEKETETNALEVAEAAVAKDAGVTDTEWIEFKQMEIEMKREDAERQNAINKAREALKLAEKLAREADEKARAEAERKAREEKERLARLEAETRRLQKLERERQKKLRCMGMCRAGFRWIKISEHGYRCAGGSHYHTFKR